MVPDQLIGNLGEYGIYEGIRVPLDYPISLDELIELHESQEIDEAEFKGKKVSIGKPKRGGSKKFYVYVKDGDKVKKVSFGDTTGLSAKLNNSNNALLLYLI